MDEQRPLEPWERRGDDGKLYADLKEGRRMMELALVRKVAEAAAGDRELNAQEINQIDKVLYRDAPEQKSGKQEQRDEIVRMLREEAGLDLKLPDLPEGDTGEGEGA